jgi:hypothetical protein
MLNRLRNLIFSLAWNGASGRSSDIGERTEALRRLLRRNPTWVHGHKLLAEEYLHINQVADAYGAALCYRQLAGDNSFMRADSALILGKCFLRHQDWGRAISLLEPALQDSQHRHDTLSHSIREELAAAHMLAENYREVVAQLEAIPETRRSAQAKAALIFARTKALPAAQS